MRQSVLGLEALALEQAALRRVATLVAREPAPQEVFDCVCEEVGRVLGVEGVNLTRFEADGTQTVLAGWSTGRGPTFPLGSGFPLDGVDGVVPRVRRSSKPERIDDYTHRHGPLIDRIRAAGIASAAAAPIVVAGRVWGAIVATTGTPHGLPERTEERLLSFADLVANAIANADARQQLAASLARIVEATDAERRRLERNLHDGAQQRLVSLALMLGEVGAQLDSDPAAARRALETAREQLTLAVDELRELARGIHPAILTDRGLRAALEALTRRAPITVRLEQLPSSRLPEPIEAAAYYLVAEAVTNAARHADADEVTVRIARTSDSLRIEVADGGVGGAALENGSGLRGLADRLEALGGRLQLSSPHGGGTVVVGEIPLSN
jgi:signal transduction histidine kinase